MIKYAIIRQKGTGMKRGIIEGQRAGSQEGKQKSAPTSILPHGGGRNFDLSLRKSEIQVGDNIKKQKARQTKEQQPDKKAFTLAEVLITLGVIGVVAAMTLPTLIKNYQKTVTATRLKTTYSTISQAVRMSEVDNGPVATWELPYDGASYSARKSFVDIYFKPYLKNVKECTNISDCIGEKIYNLDGSEISEVTKPTFILNNGVVLNFTFQGETNIQIDVSINGKKGPNIYGRDIFTIVVNKGTNNNIIAQNQSAGSVHFFCQGNSINFLKNDSSYGCNKNAQGACCGAWIMENGWKIPDDYPW